MRARFILAAALVGTLAIAGCRTAPVYNVDNTSFAIPSSSIETREQAIIVAGAKRGWRFEKAAPGHLIAKNNVRGKHYVEVDVLFNETAFSIQYRDSRDLNYDPTNREIHPSYNAWVNYLETDIAASVPG